MEKLLREKMDRLYLTDCELQRAAFLEMLAETDQPVDWAYEVWDELLQILGHKDNHVRAIAAQLLCNLAKSDPQKRMLTDFPALLAVTKDARFVTARHALQAIWKVGAAGKEQQKVFIAGLESRFKECAAEKNGTLIRYDILHGMRNLYDEVQDEAIKEKALAWIALEGDLKYRKKYAGLWKSR